MTAAAFAALRDEPRIALLRRLDDLPLGRILQRNQWHVLCDAPMEAHFLSIGLPADRLTQALEHGAFLSDGFALPCPPATTVVVATRRSEEAVTGVLRTRGIRAFPLFGELLARLVAQAPLRLADRALRDLPAPNRRLAIIGSPWSGANIALREVARLAGVEPVSPASLALAAMSEHRQASGFELTRWWTLMTRANTVAGNFVMALDWPALSRFVECLLPAERDWLRLRLSRFHVLRLNRDPLTVAAATEAAATAGAQGVDRAQAVQTILRLRDNLHKADEALDQWLGDQKAGVTTVDCDQLCRDPTGTLRTALHAAGITTVAGLTAAAPVPLPRPPGQRFDRFLEAARSAGA